MSAIGLGATGRFRSGRFSGQPAVALTYSVVITGLTDNPAYGPTAQIRVALTTTASAW